jgi:hypothetical protein
MRAFLLLAAAALSLASCRNNDQTDNNANVDENLSAENIVSNDVTAIDAVTGDAANMAADVDVNFTAQQQLVNGTSTKPAPRPATARPGTAQPKTVTPPASTPPASGNTTANAI